MKTLPVEFEKKGFHHKQVQREGLIAIVKRWKNPENPHFEVIKILEGKAFEIAGVKIEAAEIYPSANEFGQLGWTYSGPNGQDQAFAKYKDLTK